MKICKKMLCVLLGLMLLLPCAVTAFAADEGGVSYYVDSVGGDDGNDGLTPETAWKTLSRATNNTFAPGDSLLLKAGQIHSAGLITFGSGSEAAPVTVTSYGEGDRPLIFSDDITMLFLIFNVSNWVIDGIDFSAPRGAGLNIMAIDDGIVENITVKNCTFRNISHNDDSTGMAALSINCDSARTVIKNIHLDSLKFFDVGWGVHTNGINAENKKESFVDAESSYNSDFLFENIYIDGATYGGIVISSVKNALVRNCCVLNSATAKGVDAYAPLWMRHSTNVTVEYCEIAGSTNKRDGMVIDFDGWTTNSTYRYIYSHDNNRFIRNCVYDRKTKNAGNSVYNCVSVNDNKAVNHSASPLFSPSSPSLSLMHDFSFYNNTIINGSPIIWLGTPHADARDITFINKPFDNFINRLFNFFLFSKSFTYKTGSVADAAGMIEEITQNLPCAE